MEKPRWPGPGPRAGARRLRRVPGSATMRGVELQFKLAALVALRARRRGVRVRLWARAGSARPFDDLVLRLAAPAPAAPATLYVQLWHAKGQLAEKDFVEEGKKTYLGKYFTFFRKLRTLFAQKSTLPEGNEDSCILAEGSLNDVLCVLYTTKDLPAERPLPQASTTGVLAELENLLRTDTRGAEDCGFFFTAEDTQVWNLFQQKKLEDLYRHEFLPRFRVLYNQSQASHLDCLITEELNKLFSCRLPNVQYHCMDYIQLFKEWLQDENSNYCIDENFPDVEWVLAQDVRRQARQVAGEGVITFKDSYCFTLKEALCADHLRIIVPGIPVGLRAAKLLQVLDCEFPSRWLYANPQLLIQFPASVFVALCKRTWVDILVIDTDEVNPGLNEVISAVRSKVKLVEVCSVAHSKGTSCVQQLEEEWEMEHLVCRSEETLLDRPVHYQGLYVRLGDLVPKWVIPQTSMLMHTESFSPLQASQAMGEILRTLQFSKEKVFIPSATSARLQRVKGGAMMHGVELEIKLAALVALRARRARLPFELFTKAIIAKPFSDLVLRVNAQPSHVGGATVFVDLLHSKGQLDVEDFVEKEKRTHMGKYFDFYEHLQNLFSSGTGLPGIEEDDGVLYESSKGEVLFVLYTTKEGYSLKPQLQPLKDGILPVLEDIFKTNGEQSAFSFTPEDEQVWNLFEGENCERVNTYKHEFLPRFRVLCNQLHAENLDGLIAEELNGLFGCHLPNARYHQMDYVQLLREWSQDPDSNYCLSEESGDLEWVLAQDIRRHARLATGDGAVVFWEDGCAELRKALEQGHLRVIVPGIPEGIRAAKLLQLLDQEFADCWLYTSAELLTQFPAPLLTALCKAPQVEVLVIDANEVSQTLGDVINAVLDVVKLVRVCSITHNEAAPKMGQLVEIWRLEHIKRNVEDKEEKDILDRTVLYRGSLVQLRDLVPMWAAPPRPVLKDASHQTSAKSTEFSNPSHVKMISENFFADKDNRFHLPRMLGTANSFGLEFEYKIAGLLALRARRSGLRFQLFLNVAAAFPFDDIVLRIYAPQPALYLVQIKHMVSRRLMTSRDFTRKGNFSLEKYFRSFEKLRKLHRNREINMREDDRWLIDVPLENNWFVLLTTAGVSGFKPSQALSTREQIPHEYLFLTSCGRANDIIRFGPEDVEVWNLFKDNEELKIYQDGFLSQLVLFVNQVTSDKVDSLILHEIKLLLCAQEPTCQSVCFNYINWLKSWSEGNAGFCLTESSHEIEKAVVYHFQKLARAKDLCHVFAFENAYCSHLDAALVQNKSIELVVLGVPPGIRAAKLLERLDHVVSDGWMYVDDEVWKELSADILVKVALAVRVVVLDFQHEAEAQKLMQAVGDAVQVVMLYSSPKDGIECHRTGSFLCIEEDWKLEHLTMEAQEKLLDSHVLFQGDSVPLRALEAAWPRVRQEADGALLGALARGDAALGAALPGHAEDERLYIPRGLQHPSALCASALRLASAADHLALQGFAPRALRRLQDALGWSDEEARQRWTVLDGDPEAAFARVSAERSALNVHWVECVGGADGEPDAWAMAWRRTRGRTHALAALVRPATGACAREAATCVHGAAGAAGDAAAWGARAALLVGPPGAGKSCFLRRAAREARARDPARWVVYLPLLQHVRLLREMPQAPEITADHLVMLLEAAVKSDHWKSSSIVAEKRFFEAALFETGAISIFIDGFDEICPVYKDKMLRILQILLTTSVASLLWVSSRPEMLSVLQNVLGCCPVSLTPLTQEQQHSFINSHFQFSSNHTQAIVAKIVEACKSFSDDFSDLLKSPLHLKMALEVLNHEPNWCGHEFDILQLYEVFINQKQQIFMEKYGFKNWENSSIEHSVKSYNNTLFQNCAMYILVADKQFQGVDSAPFEELINKNQQILVKEKTGIMWMDENGRPHFLHYLFVEYFAASWICENLSTSETARSIMCTLYEHEISSGFHRFLDLMLSENCLLHRAVLMKDSSALTTALHSGVAVDQTDKGGRTALHLSVLHQNKDACLQLVQENCNVNARNLFLNWTPLQFVDAAWKFGKHNYLSELMKITELLLDNGAEHLPLAIIARNEAELVMEAVDKDLPKVLELILEHGITGQNYIIALNKATYGENHRTLRVLKTYYEGTPKPSRKLKKIFRVSQSTFKWAERKPRSSVFLLSNISSTSSKSIIQSLGEEYYNDTESLEHLVAEKSNTLNIATNHPSTLQDSGSVQKSTSISEFGTNAESIHNLTDLHISAFNGLYEHVDRLIKQGISVNQADKDGFTALHVAAHAGHDAVVEYLLRAGANVNLQSSEGVTALHFAASNGHEKCVKLLLQYSADANLSDKSGFTPAHLAVASGHSQVLKILSSRIDWHSKTKLRHTPLHMAAIMGCDSVIDDLLRDTTEPPEADVHGFKPIHLSSISNNAPFAELLIKQGTNPNETTDNGMTPLHLASRHGSVDVVEALLRGGADPNAITSSGAKKLSLVTEFGHKEYFESLFESGSDLNVVSKTPLHFAAEGGHSEIMKLLLENGAKSHMRNASLDTPSHSAVRSGQKECVQVLLHHGADINVQDKEGRTPLHIAARQGLMEIVKLLLERGADIRVEDASLQTPLHNAVRSGQKECVQELLHHGADINVQDKEGRTPLHIAARQGLMEIVKLLLERGADIRVEDASLQTPLHNAVRSGQKECVQELLHHGADVNIQGEDGRTPLHIAAGQGYSEIVKLLLERGADIHVKDASLETPVHDALRSGQKECVLELLHHGADVNIEGDLQGH